MKRGRGSQAVLVHCQSIAWLQRTLAVRTVQHGGLLPAILLRKQPYDGRLTAGADAAQIQAALLIEQVGRRCVAALLDQCGKRAVQLSNRIAIGRATQLPPQLLQLLLRRHRIARRRNSPGCRGHAGTQRGTALEKECTPSAAFASGHERSSGLEAEVLLDVELAGVARTSAHHA
jgi:hypothetical protein